MTPNALAPAVFYDGMFPARQPVATRASGGRGVT